MTVDRDALDRNIDGLREALAALPPDHPERAARHADLGAALWQRYDLTRDRADLDEAITHLTEAVAAAPADHPDRRRWLTQLGEALLARFERTYRRADLEAGITRLREAGVSDEELLRRRRETEARAFRLDDLLNEAARGSVYEPRGADGPASPSGPAEPVTPPPDTAPSEAPTPPPDTAPSEAPTPPPARPRLPTPAGPRPPTPDRPAPPTLDREPEPAREPAADDRRLEFAAAYRRRIEAARRHPVLFYVHRPHARQLVQELINRRAPQLGGAPAVSRAAATHAVESGTTITIVPNVVGATFEPGRIDVTVDDAVRELTFQMTVPAETPPGPLGGYIDIFVGPLIIGQVPVEFDVHRPGPAGVPIPSEGEQFLTVANASVFDKIFISYSRRDSNVVDLCIATYQGLGVQVLVDRLTLRSGDDWRATLEKMIRESDVFQLYWSQAAAASPEVGHEWRLALELSKTRDRFIRPLYWEKPMPPPPEALNHLHFSHLDLKLLRRALKAQQPRRPGLFRRVLAAVRGATA